MRLLGVTGSAWGAIFLLGQTATFASAQTGRGEICIPKDATGSDAKLVFVETLAYAELAAALKTGAGPDATRFFAGTQNAALAAALAMKFGCPNAALHKTKLKK